MPRRARSSEWIFRALKTSSRRRFADLLNEHGPFIYATPTGRAEQAKADRFHATRDEQRAIWQQNTRFKEVVDDEEQLFSDKTRTTIADVNQEDDETEDSRHPERTLVIAETTNKNLLAMVGKVATGSTVGEGLARSSAEHDRRGKRILGSQGARVERACGDQQGRARLVCRSHGVGEEDGVSARR